MKKREFLKSLGLGALSLGAARLAMGAEETAPTPTTRPTLRPAQRRRPRPNKNGVWIPSWSDHTPDEWSRTFDRMVVAGIDAIIPNVYNGHEAFWDTKKLPVKQDKLGMLIKLAHEAGLAVHAWMFCMPCQVPDVLKKHVDWYTVNAKGESAATKPAYVDYYTFLEPAHPEVREFLGGIAADLAAVPGLDGVHLDYIRYPDAILPKGLWSKYGLTQDRVYPAFDYGYTKQNREAFKKQHGVDPLKIKDKDVELGNLWLQYRLDAVTGLVNDHLVPAVHAHERPITAAVFPGPTLAREMVRQDWSRWKLDTFFPMLYHNFYEKGLDWIKAQAQEAAGAVTVPICAGLFAPALDFEQMARAVRAAFEGGASGVCLFSADAMTEERLMGVQIVVIGQRPD